MKFTHNIDIKINSDKKYNDYEFFDMISALSTKLEDGDELNCRFDTVEPIESEVEEYFSEYVPALDISVIFKQRCSKQEILSLEVVGFYFGEPDEKSTKKYIGKNYVDMRYSAY